ncbi:hypothetical protein D5086_000696 [Populus alba]|uniref:BZIP domain-containing protein n=3 Tax=Populus alba TaxID=43335 RepID=A0A4V6A5M2_POPAL|nr:uncharacterized protein LOC118036802 isoform X1 [Populus alba]XP_034898530.1 uncharacterized protein LOC118036802 isoform X1 [Populus alba]TKR90635.1 uncharacterized protein D5086_0000231260 [Populus alba]
MDSDMRYFDLSDAEIIHPSMNPLFRSQVAVPGIGENMYGIGTGSHEPKYGLADHQRHQQQTEIPNQWMVNMNNMSVNHQAALEQPAGRSPSSKDPKKLARQRSDLKYREKKKQETKDLKRKVDVLMERNEHLEKENASLKKEGDWMEKALKQGKRDVHQLKGKHDGLSTTVTEISRALAESKYNMEIQRENKRLKCTIDLLAKQMKNPDSLNTIQLHARIAQLEGENSARQLVIDALCAKMKKDVDDEP